MSNAREFAEQHPELARELDSIPQPHQPQSREPEPESSRPLRLYLAQFRHGRVTYTPAWLVMTIAVLGVVFDLGGAWLSSYFTVHDVLPGWLGWPLAVLLGIAAIADAYRCTDLASEIHDMRRALKQGGEQQ
ncbi:hypothetical protein [Sciscionella marina]|uniref:hypothetical protein n=1 Tax=Sciscionella marina TaxID=508770 RepID=UPI00035EC8C0|nr:hypothetical protein [Sciscionella marina]